MELYREQRWYDAKNMFALVLRETSTTMSPAPTFSAAKSGCDAQLTTGR